jgi:hypothetical protein
MVLSGRCNGPKALQGDREQRQRGDAVDQDPLVTEQTEAGARFLGEFQKYYPVQAAFWLYHGEDGGWRLYVASDRITDENFDDAYKKAVQAARAINDPWFDVLRVKLIVAIHPRSIALRAKVEAA